MTTVQQMIDSILKDIPDAPFPETVDTIKVGNLSQEVTGVVVTFLASVEVIEKAIKLGANLIITHEPTFYNHLDNTDWLANDRVYQAKRKLLDDHRIAVWRFHDHWHRRQPDGIVTGMMRALGWEMRDWVVRVPRQPVSEIIDHMKRTIGAKTVRVVGSLDMPCETISFMMGAPGGEWQIKALGAGVDLLIAGEINEWETSEYVRDALSQGQHQALVIIGHEISEAAGMAYMAEWLREFTPASIPITYVPTGDPFQVV